MAGQQSSSWWKSQIPTLVLLVIIVALAIWSIVSGIGVAPQVGRMTVTRGIVLAIVGLGAG
ncbi:MAG: hypothetical protein H5T69_19865, partial [Chloroflexi bacterium]|nr:hypothetical protein [Chloroflexota bacterium]